jgi:hypothetical protein
VCWNIYARASLEEANNRNSRKQNFFTEKEEKMFAVRKMTDNKVHGAHINYRIEA